MSGVVMFKSPEERLDFDIDFSKWLPSDDAILSAAISVNGGTAVVDDQDLTPSVVKLWISGGSDGETNHVSVVATTAQGRVCESCFRLRIKGC